MNESMREFNQKMESAKEAVGEALIPVANTLADFIDKIPKELLEAGVWAGMGISMATALGGAVIGIRALATSVIALGRAATTSAAETAAAATTVGTASKGAIGGKTTGLGRGGRSAGGSSHSRAHPDRHPRRADQGHHQRRGQSREQVHQDTGHHHRQGRRPGRWDRLMATVADNPVLAKMPANIFMAAGIGRLINGTTETETLAKERATSTPACNELRFEEWMASQSRSTGQWMPGDFWQAMGGGPLSVNLGSGSQMMTYDQMQQAFMKNFATVRSAERQGSDHGHYRRPDERGRASLDARLRRLRAVCSLRTLPPDRLGGPHATPTLPVEGGPHACATPDHSSRVHHHDRLPRPDDRGAAHRQGSRGHAGHGRRLCCRLPQHRSPPSTSPDEADITVDLLPATISLVAAVERESEVASLCAGFNSAIVSHLGQDLNTWLTSAGLRVHHYFRRGGNTTISPINVCPPGDRARHRGRPPGRAPAASPRIRSPTGSSTRPSTPTLSLRLRLPAEPGDTGATTFTIVGLDFAGQAQSTEVIVPGDSLLGATVDVGTCRPIASPASTA